MVQCLPSARSFSLSLKLSWWKPWLSVVSVLSSVTARCVSNWSRVLMLQLFFFEGLRMSQLAVSRSRALPRYCTNLWDAEHLFSPDCYNSNTHFFVLCDYRCCTPPWAMMWAVDGGSWGVMWAVGDGVWCEHLVLLTELSCDQLVLVADVLSGLLVLFQDSSTRFSFKRMWNASGESQNDWSLQKRLLHGMVLP